MLNVQRPLVYQERDGLVVTRDQLKEILDALQADLGADSLPEGYEPRQENGGFIDPQIHPLRVVVSDNEYELSWSKGLRRWMSKQKGVDSMEGLPNGVYRIEELRKQDDDGLYPAIVLVHSPTDKFPPASPKVPKADPQSTPAAAGSSKPKAKGTPAGSSKPKAKAPPVSGSSKLKAPKAKGTPFKRTEPATSCDCCHDKAPLVFNANPSVCMPCLEQFIGINKFFAGVQSTLDPDDAVKAGIVARLDLTSKVLHDDPDVPDETWSDVCSMCKVGKKKGEKSDLFLCVSCPNTACPDCASGKSKCGPPMNDGQQWMCDTCVDITFDNLISPDVLEAVRDRAAAFAAEGREDEDGLLGTLADVAHEKDRSEMKKGKKKAFAVQVPKSSAKKYIGKMKEPAKRVPVPSKEEKEDPQETVSLERPGEQSDDDDEEKSSGEEEKESSGEEEKESSEEEEKTPPPPAVATKRAAAKQRDVPPTKVTKESGEEEKESSEKEKTPPPAVGTKRAAAEQRDVPPTKVTKESGEEEKESSEKEKTPPPAVGSKRAAAEQLDVPPTKVAKSSDDRKDVKDKAVKWLCEASERLGMHHYEEDTARADVDAADSLHHREVIDGLAAACLEEQTKEECQEMFNSSLARFRAN